MRFIETKEEMMEVVKEKIDSGYLFGDGYESYYLKDGVFYKHWSYDQDGRENFVRIATFSDFFERWNELKEVYEEKRKVNEDNLFELYYKAIIDNCEDVIRKEKEKNNVV